MKIRRSFRQEVLTEIDNDKLCTPIVSNHQTVSPRDRIFVVSMRRVPDSECWRTCGAHLYERDQVYRRGGLGSHLCAGRDGRTGVF